MKTIQILLLLFCFISTTIQVIKAQELYFPPTSGNEWATLSPDSLNWCPDKINALYDYLEDKNSKAFILLKDGKIVLEKYFGTFTIDSSWYWASAGKSLTGFLVGIAQQEGFLDINDPSSVYLGEGWTSLANDKEQLITVKHQLSMNSGLDDLVPNRDCTLPECLIYRTDAGQRWAYHNAPYTLLDQVIENSTQRNLNQYVFQKLTQSTGIAGLYIKVDYNNVFFSKARSMARFGLLMLNNGKWDSTPIMTDSVYFNEMTNTSQELNPAYGYLWWLNGKSFFKVPQLQINFPGYMSPNAPADMYAALGKNGQFLNVVPSRNLVFVRMGNSPGDDVPFLYNDSIWQHINELDCIVSINEFNNAENDLKVFPQPASDLLNLEFSGSDAIQSYKILDLKGKILLSGTQTPVEVRNLQSGMYILDIQFARGSIRKSWLKQ
jgi:CubicO group peptidase (beta-lactamase class C family)